MALDALRCNHLAPLGFKGLIGWRLTSRLMATGAVLLLQVDWVGRLPFPHRVRYQRGKFFETEAPV